MYVEIKKYPFNKDCAFAVTLDDLHPEGKSDIERIDFGFDTKGNFWKRMDQTFRLIPDLKITIFAVADWIDRSDFPSGIFWPLRKIYRRRRSYNKGKFRLDRKKFSEWIRFLNKKSLEDKIEIAFHGLEHHASNVTCAQSQEFKKISKKDTKEKIQEMISIFKSSGILFEKGFRSPGWGLNDALHTSLSKENFLYVANASDFYSSITVKTSSGAGFHDVLLSNVDFVENLVHFCANCYPNQIDRAVDIAKNKGIIIVHAHIAKTTFGLKWVDKYFQRHIQVMIREIEYQTAQKIWFATLGEMAKFFLAKKKIKYEEITKEKIRFINDSKHPIFGLTVCVNGRNYVIDHIDPKSKYILHINSLKEKIFFPKVSIILTVFNGEKYVIDSLRSLCDQDYNNFEIIVVNDGSTDKTKDLLEEFVSKTKDGRIKIVHQNNLGRAKAKNKGIQISSGEIITFCEDDAFYNKEYVSKAMNRFQKAPKNLGGIIGPHYVWNKKSSITTRVKDIERRRNFLNYKPKSCWFYKKDILKKIGGFNEKLEFGEDVEPAIQLSKKGYYFSFEKKCLWLHQEPEKFFIYLKRKFKGGVGMALLEKMQLKEKIIPLYYYVGLIIFFLLFLNLFFVNSFPLLSFFLITAFALLFFRWKDIVKGKKISTEPFLFICFGIFVEYIWWFSTFCGYCYGKFLTREKINKYLRGR